MMEDIDADLLTLWPPMVQERTSSGTTPCVSTLCLLGGEGGEGAERRDGREGGEGAEWRKGKEVREGRGRRYRHIQ